MHNITRGLLVGLGTAAVGALLLATPWGMEFEQGLGLKALFRLRGPLPTPSEVAVAAIDDQTGAQLGISNLPREWPRSVHGQLVEEATRRGAAAIVFDFDFQLPKKDADDAAFAAAVDASGRVVLAEKLLGKRQPLLNAHGQTSGSVWLEKLVPPIASLAAAARGLGSFPLPKVEVAVHEFWVFKPSVGSAPTMPAVALQIHALDAYRKLVTLAGEIARGLPAPLPDSARAAQLREFMLALRQKFQAEPALAARLTAWLEAQTDSTVSAHDRQLMRALIGMYAGPEHRLLNFYGPPGTIRTLPYHTLAAVDMSKSVEADLHDKTLFVGFSDLFDPGQPDRFYTVYTNDEGVDLSGVEIAATAFANLLDDRSVHGLPTLQALAVPLLFGLVAGIMLYLLPAIAAVPLALVLSAVYGYGALSMFVRHDLWLPLATPLLVQLPLALFVGLVTQYLSERSKKNRATRAISLYLPAHLAHDFTEKNLDSSALDRVTYSVCFASDMAGFTTIAEQLKPKELAVFLNDYFESLSEPLRRHGVDVIEFRADGIMCAWTAEQAELGVRQRALAAALDALDAIAAFKARQGLLAQSLRIGLESGMVYVGHAGGGGHFVYSIVGDCANTAARIEGLNKHLGTQLLASAAVTAGMDELVTRFVGEFRFVGKAETVPIVEVLGRVGQCTSAQVALATRFAAAMVELEARRFEAAAEAFAAILDDYPQDGPARFQQERCRRFSVSPPSGSPWVVNMDAK
jgi:adenylate cyclase